MSSSTSSGLNLDDPLGAILHYHENARHWCSILKQLSTELVRGDMNDEQRDKLIDAGRFFSTEFSIHRQDEEKDIFPLLQRTSLKMADIIHQVKTLDNTLDELWSRLQAGMNHPHTIKNLADFCDTLKRFCHVTEKKLRQEDDNFYMLAQHLLSTDQLNSISQSMKDRRRD